MKRKTVVMFASVGDYEEFPESGIDPGPLKLPDGFSVNGDLVLFGEDENYLHCIISGSGGYYGVYKSDDENHLYQIIKKLNAKPVETQGI